jgi:hypothetical protein
MGIFKSGKYKNVYDNKENGLDNDTKGKANWLYLLGEFHINNRINNILKSEKWFN